MSRRVLAILSIPALVVLVGVVALGLRGTDGAAAGAAAHSSTSKGNTDSQESLSPPATALPVEPVDTKSLEPVALFEPADFGNGLVAAVTAVMEVDVEAARPGETAGPAAAVHLEIRNESDIALDLDGVAVNATDGRGLPLVPNFMSPALPVSGVLEPGESRSGIYVFRTDRDIDDLTIQVHHNTTPNFVVIHP